MLQRSLQYVLFLDLRPGSRLGQGVNGHFHLRVTGQGPIYVVKIWVMVKGLQPVDSQKCRITFLMTYEAATTAKVPRKGCEMMCSRWKTKWVCLCCTMCTSYSHPLGMSYPVVWSRTCIMQVFWSLFYWHSTWCGDQGIKVASSPDLAQLFIACSNESLEELITWTTSG